MKKIFIEKLTLDWKIAVLTIASTLALMMDYYHFPLFPWSNWFPGWESIGLSMKVLDRTLLYLVIPMLITKFIFRENLKEYGFSLGDWKAGIVITLCAVVLMTPILWLVGRGNSAMQSYYRPFATGLPWNTLFDLIGWEFLFRGWLLFGYARKFGPEAIWMQAVPFALAHMGKPELETLTTIFGGFAFGWVAWRTKSFLYPLLIHWFIASMIIIFSIGNIG
jgi:uncharacterized protein